MSLLRIGYKTNHGLQKIDLLLFRSRGIIMRQPLSHGYGTTRLVLVELPESQSIYFKENLL